MLRLTLLLSAALFAALLIAGEDRGQLRPGLAKAAVEGAMIVVEAEQSAPEPAPVLAAADAPPAGPAVAADPVVPRAEPEPYAEPPREVVQVLEDPIFTLSALPTESPPEALAEPLAEALPAEPEPALEPATDVTGEIWYVSADSVNVRELPSTDSGILGKLTAGEAALIIADVDGEWARIVIQGDGMEGYVALRYLSPVAP